MAQFPVPESPAHRTAGQHDVPAWPPGLQAAMAVIRDACLPMALFWGVDLTPVCNSAFETLLARAPHGGRLGDAASAAGSNLWPVETAMLRQTMREARAVQCPTRGFRLADGGQIFLKAAYSPVRDADGCVAGVLLTLSETSAHEAGAMTTLQKWFDQAPGFVALLRGPEFIVQSANRAYCDLVGQTRVVGRPVIDALAGEQWREVKDKLNEVYCTGTPFLGQSLRLRVRREASQGGDEVFVHIVVQPVLGVDDAVEGLFLQGHDVSDQVRAVHALRDSEARLRLAAEASSLGTFDYDVATGTLLLSDEAQDILAVSGASHRMDGARLSYPHIHPIDDVSMRRSFAQAMRGDGEHRYRVRYRVERPGQAPRWVLAVGQAKAHRAAPTQRRATRLIGVLLDITEQQRHVQAMQEANRRKDEFLATLAHELRNPLAPIRQAAVLSQRDPLDPVRLRWSQAVIERQVRHMALLLDDLLDVSRISRGQFGLRRSCVPLAQVVEAAVETAGPAIQAREHALTVALPPAPIELFVDAVRVAQILSNLLTNAAKYTPRGGRIALRASCEGDELVVRVEDNGIGLSRESLEAIFEMFTQVDPVLERGEGGLGIGLALSRGLAQLHGGSLSAYSRGLSCGAEFTLRLPLPPAGTRQAADCAEGAPTRRSPPQRQAKVLLADDNRDALESLAWLLEAEGFQVTTASSGEAALRQAREALPDIAILDIGMPDRNGYEVAQALRAEPVLHRLGLIALSGWGQHGDKMRAAQAGFDLHLTKPVELARLLRALDELAPSRLSD